MDYYKPDMKEGAFYELNPPANVQGEIYRKVQCEYQVPGKPNEYCVKGIPEGSFEEKPFLLIFTATGKVVPTLAESQNF